MAKQLSRRGFIKAGALAAGALAASALPGGNLFAAESAHAAGLAGEAQATEAGRATVYFTRDLSVTGLKKLYGLVKQNLGGSIAVKLHTGEPNAPNIIPAAMVREFMPEVPGGSIVECNVLYGSPRQNTAGHRRTLEANGFTFCPVDIMDAEGDANLPIRGGKWLTELAVGKNLLNYDSMLVLTHFKGHAMGGFGGSLKNIAIGCASGKVGKEQLHREGTQVWSGGPNFMERMVEGGKAIADHFGPRIAYINVLRNMSVDCDCAGASAAAPTAPDLGIMASTDLLAIDRACVDMIYALPEAQRRDLVERIESRSGLRQLEYMAELGLGNPAYNLVTV